jgi:hypothetical protein
LGALLVMKSGQFLELRRFSAFASGVGSPTKNHRLSDIIGARARLERD